jgi:hypothetical protein
MHLKQDPFLTVRAPQSGQAGESEDARPVDVVGAAATGAADGLASNNTPCLDLRN